jgi:carbon-monoxide dehydrogenase large subunit
MPSINVDFSPVASKSNPLGVKGVGEGGTVASTPTVINAILDALQPYGVGNIEMPATPQRVWESIHNGARKAAE